MARHADARNRHARDQHAGDQHSGDRHSGDRHARSLAARHVVTIDIAAGPDEVWEHLRDPAKLRRWFAWDGPALDAEIHRSMLADVAAVDGGATGVSSLTWRNGDVLTVRPAGVTWVPPRPTGAGWHGRVRAGGGSHLEVTRRSHEGRDAYDGVHDAVDEDWIAFAHQLRFALEVHPGEERRTIRTADLDAGPAGNLLIDRLGLYGLRSVPTGGHVEARRPDGTFVGGTVWHTSRHQVGIVTDGWTAALLVLHTTPAASRPPHGFVTAQLSVYGVTADELAGVERRWDAWWGAATGRGFSSERASTGVIRQRVGAPARR